MFGLYIVWLMEIQIFFGFGICFRVLLLNNTNSYFTSKVKAESRDRTRPLVWEIKTLLTEPLWNASMLLEAKYRHISCK